MKQWIGDVHHADFSTSGEDDQLILANLAHGPEFVDLVLISFTEGFGPHMAGTMAGMRATLESPKDHAVSRPIPLRTLHFGRHLLALKSAVGINGDDIITHIEFPRMNIAKLI